MKFKLQISHFLTVFDVVPMSKSYYVTLGFGIEFIVPEIAI